MVCIKIVSIFFILLIIYNFYITTDVIEGIDTDSSNGYIQPSTSSALTAASAAAKLKDLEQREKKYAEQMNQLNDMKKKMDSNTQSIAAMQKGIATCEANQQSGSS